LTTPDGALDHLAHLLRINVELAQDAHGDAVLLAHQAQQEMFRADVVVIEANGLFLCCCQDTTSSFGKPIEFIRHSAPSSAKPKSTVFPLSRSCRYP